MAYGGLGPRFMMLAGVPDYDTIYNDPGYDDRPNDVAQTLNAY